VERIFLQVNVAKREAEVQLDNKDFDERQHNYRRKKWMVDGLDPDAMEEKYRKDQKRKYKERKEERRQAGIEWKQKSDAILTDERFQNVEPREKPVRKTAVPPEAKKRKPGSLLLVKKGGKKSKTS
jgi:ATP-dependent RNA helicase DDX49/DBP8